MNKLMHRFAALFVSAAVVFTIGSARSEDLPAVDFETRSLAVECLENGGFETATPNNNNGHWSINNPAAANYATVPGWGKGGTLSNGNGGYKNNTNFKSGTYFAVIQKTGFLVHPFAFDRRGIYTLSYRYVHRDDWNPTQSMEYSAFFTNTTEKVANVTLFDMESVPCDNNNRTMTIQYLDLSTGDWELHLEGHPSGDSSVYLDDFSLLCTAYPEDVYVTHSEPKVAGDDVYRGPVTVTEGMVISAPTRQISIGGGNVVACTGWKIYYYAPVAKAYMAEASRSGEGTTYTVTAEDVGRGFILEWQWAPDTLKFIPGDDLITNGGFEDIVVTDATRSYWSIKAEPTASTQAIVDGWDGSGKTIVLNGKNGYMPRGKIINGTYCGGVKQTATLTQHLLTGYPAVFTLSYRYLHRDDYQPENAFTYWVSLGEQQLFEETIAGNDNALKTKNVEKIYAPAGDNALTFESNQTVDQMIYLDDVALVCTALPDQFVITHALPVTGDGIQNSVFAVQSGDVFTAPATADLPPEFRVRCTGWKLYRYMADDLAYGAEPIREGAGTTFTVAAEDLQFDANGHLVGLKLEWQWEDLYKLTIEADPNANGTVSIDVIDGDAGAAGATAEAWLATGTKVQMTFHPASAGGYRAIKLTSDQPTDMARPTMNTVTFTVEKKNVSFVTGAYGFDDGYLAAEDPAVAVTCLYGDKRRVYVFTNVAVKTLSVFVLRDLTYDESLVVAGGGGGGENYNFGGGGGGGVIRDASVRALAAGSSIGVTVGKGGAASVWMKAWPLSGGDSRLEVAGISLCAIGGGRGNVSNNSAESGGSGGGGYLKDAGKGTPGQGYDGAAGNVSRGGGGGGAEEPGGAATGSNGNGKGGKGGDGRWDTITGTLHCYGSGGGGSVSSNASQWNGEKGDYLDPPGEGGAESGGRAGVYSVPSPNPKGYTLAGQDGVDGLGGGGGASRPGGKGGDGTVILALSVGDTTAKRFAFDAFETYPFDGSAARPEPEIRDAATSAALEKGADYDLFYENNDGPGKLAYLVIVGKGAYAGTVVRYPFRTSAVRFVKPGVTDGAATGADWEHAMNLTNAVNGLTNATYDIWCAAGTYDLSSLTAALAIRKQVAIRGGYAADPDDISRKAADGAKTVITGGGRCNTAFSIAYGVSLIEATLRGIRFADCSFERFTQCAVVKNSSTSFLEFDDCRFLNNLRRTDATATGSAITCADNGDAPFICRNCSFEGNRAANGVVGVIYANNAAITFEGCSFVTNCLPYTWAAGEYTQSGYGGILRTQGNNTTVTFRGCDVRGNVMESDFQGPSLFRLDSLGDILFDGCRFVGNTCYAYRSDAHGYDGMIEISYQSEGTTARFNGCTFAYNTYDSPYGAMVRNDSAGGVVNKGFLLIENCIFWGNRTQAWNKEYKDVSTFASGGSEIRYSLFETMATEKVFNARVGAGVIAADPLFVSDAATVSNLFSTATTKLVFDPAKFAEVLALDVHLRSPAGYRRNGDATTWHTDTGDLSEAIDKGDPAADWTNEPEGENGKRRNLGCYGNTDEASKTPVANPAIPTPSVTFSGGWTQPRIAFTAGGDGAYNIQVMVSVSSNGTDWIDSSLILCKNGTPVSWLAPVYFIPGGQVYVKTSYDFQGQTVTKDDYAPTDVSGELPPWYGKGGNPAKVVHLWPEATGKNDGTSWANAFTSLDTALRRINAAKRELWIAGTNVADASRNVFVYNYSTFAPFIRGGFTGRENTPEDRKPGARSVIDGQDKAHLLCLTTEGKYPIAVECLELTRGYEYALTLGDPYGQLGTVKGASVTNVLFSRNAALGLKVGGALYVNSNGRNGARVTLSGCTFSENIQTSSVNTTLSTGVAYFKNSNLWCDDCLFVSNGAPHVANASDATFRVTQKSPAVFLELSSVRMTGCRFIANRGKGATNCGIVFAPYSTADDPGHVYCFTNCLFLANELIGAEGSEDDPGAGVVCSQWQTATTSEVVNCTFACNVTTLRYCGGGFSAPTLGKGRMRVVNSIFHANVNAGRNQPWPNPAQSRCDIAAGGGNNASVSYCCVDSTNDLVNIAIGNRTALMAADPRFVSATEEMTNIVITVDGWKCLDWTQPEKIMSLNVHLRGKGGYIDETTGEKVAGVKPTSPCVDAGDPKSDYRRETKPRGYRVNMGFYGNTPYQTQTTPGMAVRVK